MLPKPVTIRLLLIEDSPSDIVLIQASLAESKRTRFQVETAETLEDGIAAALATRPEVVLLDLGLPDSDGLESLIRFRQQYGDGLVFVLTGLDDDDSGFQAIEYGATDYLVKSRLPTAFLGRMLRYALERRRLERELEQRRQRQRQESEVRRVESLSTAPNTATAARIYSGRPLRESHPTEFQQVLADYRSGLNGRMLDNGVAGGQDLTASAMRDLGNRLGYLRAGPRDVIDAHLLVLKEVIEGAPTLRAQVYLEEARTLVLELMGYLADYYRHHGLR
ncbi:MAG: response regulator [Bryobacteraceae bacterium]